jgi:L-fuconolactonase
VSAEPWAELPKVLALAKLQNVAIKISGACTLSHEPFPYKDIWDPVSRVIDAFGIDRCMWGTDWTRAVKFLTYAQGVDAFRLNDRISQSDKAKLMGGTVNAHLWLVAAAEFRITCLIYQFRRLTRAHRWRVWPRY